MKLAALCLFLTVAAITIAVVVPAAQAGICAGCGVK